jgi:hypothetical protein
MYDELAGLGLNDTLSPLKEWDGQGQRSARPSRRLHSAELVALGLLEGAPALRY